MYSSLFPFTLNILYSSDQADDEESNKGKKNLRKNSSAKSRYIYIYVRLHFKYIYY